MCRSIHEHPMRAQVGWADRNLGSPALVAHMEFAQMLNSRFATARYRRRLLACAFPTASQRKARMDDPATGSKKRPGNGMRLRGLLFPSKGPRPFHLLSGPALRSSNPWNVRDIKTLIKA